jgi:hypothetical protein
MTRLQAADLEILAKIPALATKIIGATVLPKCAS